MKNFFLIVILLQSLNLFSQEETADQWILGGSIGFNHSKNASIDPGFSGLERNQNQAILSPYFGRKWSSLWYGGVLVDAGYHFSKTDLNEDNLVQKDNVLTLGVGVFARYALAPQSRTIHFYLEPSILFTSGLHSAKLRDVEVLRTNSNSLSFGLDPVFIYDLSPSVGLLLRINGLNFEFGQWKVDDDTQVVKQQFSRLGGILDLTQSQVGIEFRL